MSSKSFLLPARLGVGGGHEAVPVGRPHGRSVGQRPAHRHRLRHQHRHRCCARRADRQLPLGRGAVEPQSRCCATSLRAPSRRCSCCGSASTRPRRSPSSSSAPSSQHPHGRRCGPRRSQGLVNASYTLGAGRLTILRRVLLPYSWPGIIDVARVNLAAGMADAGRRRVAGGPGGLAFRACAPSVSARSTRCSRCSSCSPPSAWWSDLALQALRNRTAPWSEGKPMTRSSSRP